MTKDQDLKSSLSNNAALCVSMLSLLIALVSGVMFVANIDKTNAIQESQIASIDLRLDKIEAKIDKLFYKD